jgi:hypothetical protein
MSTIFDHFRDGGFGMFPTLLFGVLLLVAGARYAMKPEKRVVPLLLGLGILTMSAGALGFVTGVIVACRYFGNASGISPSIVLVGVGEALNNVAFALMFVSAAALAGCLGAYRIARGTVTSVA